jgi:pyruvate/2-oxoglutarate dehydrogenase complex dihydrolipoamide dehydrogenase (E3) component
MAKKFDALIIGTGQAGPSLANRLTESGMQVAIIERKQFGGTCVNTGCTPTKALVANAKAVHTVRSAASFGIQIPSFSLDMKAVKARKDGIVNESASGLKHWLQSMKGCTVIEGQGVFKTPHSLQVNGEHLEAERIFINVGCRAAVPKIENLESIPYFDNSSMMSVDFLPKQLLIIGGGYIALEFAQMYRRFGSSVTVLQRNPHLMPKEDHDISEEIQKILEKSGINILTGVTRIAVLSGSTEGKIRLSIEHQGQQKEIAGSHLLVATGRIPNTEDLGLDQGKIARDEKGFIKVDDRLQTSQPHIWALGDCNGRGAFTHTAYNDYEIVADNLLNRGNRRVSDRIPIYALYIDPPLGRVGLTEREAQESGKNIAMGKMPMTRVARAREKGETDGFMKIVVDRDTKYILGASLLGTGCDEVVQMIADVIYAKAPYTSICKGVHIHPTVSELIPTLLEQLQPLKTVSHAKG